MIDSSELLSNTKDKAATVGPQIRVNKSWSNDPEGTWRKNPSLVVPLFNKTYNTTIHVVLYYMRILNDFICFKQKSTLLMYYLHF